MIETIIQNLQTIFSSSSGFALLGVLCAAHKIYNANVGLYIADVGAHDFTATSQAVSLPARRLGNFRLNVADNSFNVSLRRAGRNVRGLRIRINQHNFRPVHTPPDTSFV